MGLVENARSALIEYASLARIVPQVPKLLPRSHWNSARYVQELAREQPGRPALLFENERYTWREVNERANQYAGFFESRGIGPGDTVALLMDNRPDFLFIETALNKLRAITALINTNLTGAPLTHAIEISKCKAVLSGGEHAGTLAEVLPSLDGIEGGRDVWVQLEHGNGDTSGLEAINQGVDTCPPRERGYPLNRPKVMERMCYIYTSGTTGLPKAAVIRNQRWLMASAMFARTMGESRPQDVIYCSLPLYHSSAQFAGWGHTLISGCALALRRRFSASKFWEDVRRYQATHFIYIGELCRYLMNHPPQPGERNHRLRMGIGNGLRPDIWTAFQERFGVPSMREFYGSTEGNAALVNAEGRPGMVGRLQLAMILVRCDQATGEPLRDAQGLCAPCKAGETGLLLGRINPYLRFDGYLDKSATKKKIIRDVLKKGDAYFDTGDLLTLHENKWLSFADRVGDTFRWKGENVSTNEVAEVLNGAQGVLESNVYGVQVPHAEGRAGMASLTVSEDFDVGAFAQYVTKELPLYQRPYFIRVLEGEMNVTGTFKHQKIDYREQGFDPAKVADPLFFLLDGEHYLPLDAGVYAKMQSGELSPR